jgi:hypothetical protein
MLQTVIGQGYFQNLTNADFYGSLWETGYLADSDLNYFKERKSMIKAGDMFKNIESGKMFKVKSVNPSMIILATKDESHSMFVNPNNIESAFLPFVEDEVKEKLK